ncbi:MAG: hypothetical protein HRT58_22015, partial [Crocinitomicaceae bacterium]|nr:hypothetical protein [Flavobacteriales bacterium]NQZ38352.1 hypothetical protein [Crocinitomicaceae bacterium]
MRIFLYLTTFFVLFSFTSLAGSGSWVQRLSLGELMMNTDYMMLSPIWNLQEDFEYENRVGLIHLDYTRKDHSDLSLANDWRLYVDVEYTEGSSTYTKTLTISYEAGSFQYSDYVKFGISAGELGFSAKVTGVSGQYFDGTNWYSSANPQNDIHFPLDIDFRMELREEHWYDLDVSPTTFETSQLNFDPQTYRSNWRYFEGAEQYDFEWVWIDVQSSEYSQVTSGGYAVDLPFELKEPSRVRVSHTHHTIDKTYSEGKLFFRVRGISKYPMANNAGIYDQIKEGEW